MTAANIAPIPLPTQPIPGWTLRELESADIPAILALDRACFGGIWSESGYQREIDSPNSTLVVLETAAQADPVGVACAWAILDEAHITLLGVRPNWRQRGLGQLLLATLLQDAQQRGLARATLEVRASNQSAIALYEKFGFRVAGDRPNYYQNPPEAALILWRGSLDRPQTATQLGKLYRDAISRHNPV
ncbi:MAG: ribosomal protein S18-alanine N-acetyltransferase [Cyanobacteria bacterium J06641_5]